ncbi:MAG: SH3 domain-containing protein, partial [Thermostichales cyanobacterium GMQP_bins_62]
DLDIDERLSPGALIILWEMGEYRAALDLSMLLRQQRHPATLDLLLTQVLCQFKLAREAWQGHDYEQAALYFQQALSDLESYRSFPHLQRELSSELKRLRPYRIVQLLSAPANTPERQQALMLLQTLIQERGGLERHLPDGSNLSPADFMRFLERCRRHMSLSEQQSLFESILKQSNQPEPVATYITAQTLLARALLENRPSLVRRARRYLRQFSHQPDLSLERSICALMLGNLEEALACLDQSSDQEALNLIRQYSQGSPDLLQGLCRYTEQWFSQEIFPQYAGLEGVKPSLDRYFSNPQVTTYLDEMPPEEDGIDLPFVGVNRPVVVERPPAEVGSSPPAAARVATAAPPPPVAEPSLPRAADLPPPRRSSASSRRRRSTRAPLLFTLGTGVTAIVLMGISWQVLKGLFTPAAPPVVPVADLPPPPPPPPPTPAVAITPSIPAPWADTRRVRILSTDGVRIREQPNVQSRTLGTALFREEVPVIEIELGTDNIPVWLRIQHPRQGSGWIAAQIDTRPLVEKLP